MFNFWNSTPPPSAGGIKETSVTPIKKLTSDLVQQRALAFGDDLTSPITSPSTAPAGKCVSCDLLIHKVERVSVEGKVYHKNCLRCGVLNSRQDVIGCNRLLPPTPDNYVIWHGVPYCKACHSKYFHHGQIKNTLGRVVDIKPDDVGKIPTITDRSSFNGGNTNVPVKIQEAEQRVSRNSSRDNSPYRDRKGVPVPVSPGPLVEQGRLINHKNDGATTSKITPSLVAIPTTTTTTTTIAATTTTTPSNNIVPNPNPPISTSSATNQPPSSNPLSNNGFTHPSTIEPYWTEPYNPQAPSEVVLDDLNSLIQNLLLRVDYSTKQDPRNRVVNKEGNVMHQTNEDMDSSALHVMTSEEREALLHSIQNLDRLIAALSFPLPLTETSKPNGQEVVNDLVAFLSLLKIQPRIRERLVGY